MRRRRIGLAGQLTAVTSASVVVGVVLAGLVAVGLVRHAYDGQARAVLHREALLVARLSEQRADRPAAGLTLPGRPAGRVLSGAGIRVLRVHADGSVDARSPATPRLPAADLAAAARGFALQAQRTLGGHGYFLDAEPVPGDGAVVLLQRSVDARGVSGAVLRRLLAALVAGLLGALLLGGWLARRTARPLVQTAAAARELAAGRRDVRVRPDGPAEVAAVAESLNSLAASLAASEARQREFLLSVSHELRTPLTAVLGFSEALADGVTPAGEAAAAGATIHREADRLHRLVSDLLDLARLGADDFRVDLADVDLFAMVAAAAAVWSRRCSDVGVLFAAELPEAPLRARTDPTRLRQVLDGLLENALRVTPAGRPIVVALRRDGTAAELGVRDGGPGLTDADLPVAFDRAVLYERYRGVRQVGTGVGLSLVAGLVRRLGGEVTAGHSPEGGAAFVVRLPLGE